MIQKNKKIFPQLLPGLAFRGELWYIILEISALKETFSLRGLLKFQELEFSDLTLKKAASKLLCCGQNFHSAGYIALRCAGAGSCCLPDFSVRRNF